MGPALGINAAMRLLVHHDYKLVYYFRAVYDTILHALLTWDVVSSKLRKP